MGKLLRKVIFIFAALCIIMIGILFLTNQKIFKLISLICGLISFHLAIRVYVGEFIDKIFKNQMNYKLWWFKEHFLEKPLYKLLRVRKWKNHMPTYDPDLFDITKHTYKEILMAMCQAEVVHEVNIMLGFVPLIFAFFMPEFFLFLLITCIFSGMIDSIFVMMQRYNKPRIRRIVDKQEKIASDT